MAYKYFLGLSPEDQMIDPSLLTKFRKTRITEDILEELLKETIRQAIEKGLVKSGTIIVDATLSVASYILAEAGLSFLGMGVPSNIPTWGNIINAAKRLDIIQTMPMLWIAPGVAISLFVLSINFFGDGLRDVFDAAQ